MAKRFLKHCGFVLFCISIQGCAMRMLDWATPEEGYSVQQHLAYADLPRQHLDVYTPTQSAANKPTILFFYGGSWQDGRKEDYRFVAQALTQRGYQVVVPDYRVYPDALFPEFMDDAAQALSWTASNLDQPIVVMGHSAGAHIAALLALDQQYANRYKVNSDRIVALVGLSGPYDFLPLKSKRLKKIFAAAENIEHTQPINYVTAAAPTTLLLQGESDTVVKPFNSQHLADKLEQHGVEVTLKLYPGEGHVATLTALSVLFDNEPPVMEDIDQFLSKFTD